MRNKNYLKHPKQEPASQKEAKAMDVSNVLTNVKKTELLKEEAYTEFLAAIVESSDDAIISKSLEGKITSWNKGSEKMFGYTASQAIGKPITMLIPAEFLNQEKDILEKIKNNIIIDHFETVRIKKNGDHFHVSLSISPLRDKTGTIIGASKIARDISLRKISDAEIIRINKELAFESSEKEKRTAELMVANKELAFQNNEKEKRAAELVIANEELIFQNNEKEKRAAELIIVNKELIFQSEEKEKRTAELIIANQELIFQSAEKESRAAELVVANQELSFQNKEKEKRASELLTAISDLKASEEQIIEVNKELESFSYSVSHDLRAPLRAINGYTKMLKANFENQLDTEANRLMNNIVNNANKMGRLIDDLLTFSRVGRRELVKMHINMDIIVADICNEFKNDQPSRNIQFHIAPLPPAQADNTGIKQVWLNLISNAVKYSGLKDTAIIDIGAEIKGNEVIYYVKDNGAGFDMRYAAKLFGVFQRLHSDEEFEGTGVGLALVHRIISKHGGRVWGAGKVNQGAAFYFTLLKS